MNYLLFASNLAVFTTNMYLLKDFFKTKEKEQEQDEQIHELKEKITLLEMLVDKLLQYSIN